MKWRDRLRVAYRAITLGDFPAFKQLLELSTSAAGVAVTERTALNNSPFWCGVNMIAGQIAALPRIVYRRLPNDDRERDRTQPASKVLERPNPNSVDVVFWETLLAHVLTWGNAFAEIEWDRAWRPIALHVLTPDTVEPKVGETFIDGQPYKGLFYLYRQAVSIHPSDIIHIPGLGFDGVRGYSVVQMARESLGLGLAAERFGASFFGNGAWPGLVLKHPGELSAPAQARLLAQHNDSHAGAGRAHRVKILEEGMTVEKVGIPPDDAQFLETRQFQVEEIARWLNINPAKLKLKVGERPGGNLEASQLEFLTDTLRPWMVRIEQELNRKLFPPAQRDTFYVEHLVDALLRTDSKARAEAYKAYIDMGVMTPDYVAKKENLPPPPQPPPVPEPEPEEEPAEPEEETETETETEPRAAWLPAGAEERLWAAVRRVIIDRMAWYTRREANLAKRAAKRGAVGLADWAHVFYAEEAGALEELLAPAVDLALALRGMPAPAARPLARALANGYLADSLDRLLELRVNGDGIEAQVVRLVDRWALMRPVQMADAIVAAQADEGVSDAA